MKKHEAERIIETIRGLIEEGKAESKAASRLEEATRKVMVVGKIGEVHAGEPVDGDTAPAVFDDVDKERLYQQFKARLLTECPIDPVLLHIVTQRPEVRIEVEPRLVQLDDSSLRGRIAILIAEGVIRSNEPIKRAAINAALSRTGPTPAGNRFAEALTSLVNDGILIRGEDDGQYLAAPGLKITKTTIGTA